MTNSRRTPEHSISVNREILFKNIFKSLICYNALNTAQIIIGRHTLDTKCLLRSLVTNLITVLIWWQVANTSFLCTISPLSPCLCCYKWHSYSQISSSLRLCALSVLIYALSVPPTEGWNSHSDSLKKIHHVRCTAVCRTWSTLGGPMGRITDTLWSNSPHAKTSPPRSVMGGTQPGKSLLREIIFSELKLYKTLKGLLGRKIIGLSVEIFPKTSSVSPLQESRGLLLLICSPSFSHSSHACPPCWLPELTTIPKK